MRMARANWKQEEPRLDPQKLVFIDETGASTNMTRPRGRCRARKAARRQSSAGPLNRRLSDLEAELEQFTRYMCRHSGPPSQGCERF